MRKMKTLMLAALLVFALCAACHAADESVTEASHLRAINAARRAAGLAEVKLSRAMMAAAKTRAQEIVSKFEHTRPDGREPYTAIAGWESDKAAWGLVSENISMLSEMSSAAGAVGGFMESPGHKANILAASNRWAGVASFTAGGRRWWVELFAASCPNNDEYTPKDPLNITTITTNVYSGYDRPVNDLFNASAPDQSLNGLLKASQKQGRSAMLVILWSYCNFGKNFLENLSKNAALKDSEYVDIYLVGFGTRDGIVSKVNSYGSALKGWKNARSLYSTNRMGSSYLYTDYLTILGIPHDDGASTPLIALYHDDKIISWSQGIEASDLMESWAQRVAEMHETAGGGQPQEEERTDPKTKLERALTAAPAVEAMLDKRGPNAIAFASDGSVLGVTSASSANRGITARAGQTWTHAIYLLDGDGVDLDGRSGSAEMTVEDETGKTLASLTKSVEVFGGYAAIEIRVDDIIAAARASDTRGADEGDRKFTIRMSSPKEALDFDLTTKLTIKSGTQTEQSGGGSGGCSATGACAALALALAILKRKI